MHTSSPNIISRIKLQKLKLFITDKKLILVLRKIKRKGGGESRAQCVAQGSKRHAAQGSKRQKFKNSKKNAPEPLEGPGAQI